jgi:hypothetical protein
MKIFDLYCNEIIINENDFQITPNFCSNYIRIEFQCLNVLYMQDKEIILFKQSLENKNKNEWFINYFGDIFLIDIMKSNVIFSIGNEFRPINDFYLKIKNLSLIEKRKIKLKKLNQVL